ncbi:MAG: amidohydrolase [Pirellulales bacterium]|nr:amidohydrolase [Pirellulales bacterium]
MPEPVVDSHVHIFCWGENPQQGYLSEALRRRWLTRVIRKLSGVDREPGETLSEKMRNRLLRQFRASSLDRIVVLAQDAVYREDGSRDDAATHFFVSNDYVLDLARDNEGIIACPSINPWRRDAIAELERCHAAGARIVKIHTAIQGVDPSLARFDSFYLRAKQLDVVLIFHTGYEHSCQVVSQKFTDPARLARPLDTGATVIAAHCGTCAFFDPESYYGSFIKMMHRYDNLYGDTAILASLIRPRALARLSKEPTSIRRRIVHGSDYPLPPSRLPYLNRVGLFPAERRNPLDMDLRIKRSFELDPEYTSRILQLIGQSP